MTRSAFNPLPLWWLYIKLKIILDSLLLLVLLLSYVHWHKYHTYSCRLGSKRWDSEEKCIGQGVMSSTPRYSGSLTQLLNWNAHSVHTTVNTVKRVVKTCFTFDKAYDFELGIKFIGTNAKQIHAGYDPKALGHQQNLLIRFSCRATTLVIFFSSFGVDGLIVVEYRMLMNLEIWMWLQPSGMFSKVAESES